MARTRIPRVHVYHRWQVFDLSRQLLTRVMAMNKQYKLEKHLAKHYNR